MMMMMMLEARNFVVVIGENLDDETRRRKTEFLKRFVNIRQRKKNLGVSEVQGTCCCSVYHSVSFQCKACNNVALFLLFYKDTDSFFLSPIIFQHNKIKKLSRKKPKAMFFARTVGNM